MEFSTLVCCMDGRIQKPLREYMISTLGASWIDTITEPGVCKLLADGAPAEAAKSLDDKIALSVNAHKSKLIVVSGHHDCYGNPVDRAAQLEQLKKCRKRLEETFPTLRTVMVYVNDRWEVEEIG
jgi:carbonic anhydrase